MNISVHNRFISFIWYSAGDCLRDVNVEAPDFNIDEGFKVVLWGLSLVGVQVPGK